MDAPPPGADGPLSEAVYTERFDGVRPRVLRLCRRMLVEPAAAEDACQEVFLRGRRSLATYDPAQPFEPWLMAIANHYCIDQLRRRATERKLFQPDDLAARHLADPAPDPLRRASEEERRVTVTRAIEELPAKFRLPLVLRYYAELDYDAIAGVLAISRSQVGTLLFRAKRRLRESLRPELAPGEDHA